MAGATLTVPPGQTLALVGESGSGKSTMAAAVLGLLPAGRPDHRRAHRVRRHGPHRGRRTAMRVHPGQAASGTCPRTRRPTSTRCGTSASRSGKRCGPTASPTAAVRCAESLTLLSEVGMPDPATRARQYPHQLSGGMCQRALIAIGLAGRPRLLIADEPTSALDVTVQRQVLDHLQRLAAELGTSVLLITHDLALAAERADQHRRHACVARSWNPVLHNRSWRIRSTTTPRSWWRGARRWRRRSAPVPHHDRPAGRPPGSHRPDEGVPRDREPCHGERA